MACDGDLAEELDRILRERLLTSVFQPIVDLASGNVVAYEALTRGPHDSPLRTPARLFATAAAAGRVSELDRQCRETALRSAARGLPSWATLFVNLDLAGQVHPGELLLEALCDAAQTIRLVVEATERIVSLSAADVLASLVRLNAAGIPIAIDDIGANARSVALLPFVRPELIKLDMALVHGDPALNLGEILHAVERWRDTALVVAEGIETEQHLDRARAIGAQLGQGWLFGRPDALPEPGALPEPASPLTALRSRARRRPSPASTPFQLVSETVPARVVPASMFDSLAWHLEEAAVTSSKASTLVVCRPAAELDGRSSVTLTRVAAAISLVVVAGTGSSGMSLVGVDCADIAYDDPLAYERAVCLVTPNWSAAVVAWAGRDPLTRPDESLACCVTHDQVLIASAASLVLARLETRER